MRAVWSLWSKPFLRRNRTSWASETDHLCAWVLSVETARVHYPDTCLITDDAGARLLVDGLGLEFCHISTALNVLAGSDPDWWALGKLHAYRMQSAPFVHIDTDVFLWDRLPAAVERAAVFAQSPEPFTPGNSHYQPEQIEWVMRGVLDAWFPDEWCWYRGSGRNQRGECCGILGGTHTDFIRHYADRALRLVDHGGNQPGWARLYDKIGNMIMIEQYMLAACVEYHRARTNSPFAGLEIAYLLDSSLTPLYNGSTGPVRYTHLIGLAKKDTGLMERLRNRVQRDYTALYERCLQIGARSTSSGW